MNYIDLNKITEDHICGEWIVQEHQLNKGVNENVFSHIRLLNIFNGEYSAVNGKTIEGRLVVALENKIIYNPQLRFYQDSSQIANAIITRLYKEIEKNKEVYKLTLYFSTGLELILKKMKLTANG